MTFRSVEEVNAYYASIPPPPDIGPELEACNGDPLLMANVAIRSAAKYLNTYCVPLELPERPPALRRWWR